LVIGSLDAAAGGKTAGGTTISLQCLVDELQRRGDVELSVVDIGCSREKTGLLKDIGRAMSFIRHAAQQIHRDDVVSLHTVSTKLWFTGMMTLLLSRVAHKPLLIRKFAGTDYNDFPFWKRTLTKWVLSHCDMYLAQTRHLVEVAKSRDGISHCRWFPTHRPMNSTDKPCRERTACRRFVYVGHVREYKGIRELVEAAERLDASITVDVYGPIFDDLPADLFDRRQRIFYKGFLNHRNVVSTMQQYDAFILPTKAISEGYPGAILEAYAAGLPVITTTCGAIPEIVDESSGILVEPRNVEALYQAMMRLSEDSKLYVRLCKGAREQAGKFSAEHWAKEFVAYCREIDRNKSATTDVTYATQDPQKIIDGTPDILKRRR